MRNLQKIKDLELEIKGIGRNFHIRCKETYYFTTEYEMLRFLKHFHFADEKVVAITWGVYDRKNNDYFSLRDYVKRG